VTLILAMNKPEGIFMSVDYRITENPSGRVIDDSALKFLHYKYPGAGGGFSEGGPEAMFAYTGLAQLPDGTDTHAWLAETLRGETEVIDLSMKHLQERLDRDYAKHLKKLRQMLIINVFVCEGERRLFGGLTNLKSDGTILDSFGYVMRELDEPEIFANGGGAAAVAADSDIQRRLKSQLNVVPRKPRSHMNLLADTNRRVASLNKGVSPHCHVAYLPGDERTKPDAYAFAETGEPVPMAMPFILFGIDLGLISKRFMEDTGAWIRGETDEPPQHRPFSDDDFTRRP
jgi:hypothetical protein